MDAPWTGVALIYNSERPVETGWKSRKRTGGSLGRTVYAAVAKTEVLGHEEKIDRSIGAGDVTVEADAEAQDDLAHARHCKQALAEGRQGERNCDGGTLKYNCRNFGSGKCMEAAEGILL